MRRDKQLQVKRAWNLTCGTATAIMHEATIYGSHSGLVFKLTNLKQKEAQGTGAEPTHKEVN